MPTFVSWIVIHDCVTSKQSEHYLVFYGVIKYLILSSYFPSALSARSIVNSGKANQSCLQCKEKSSVIHCFVFSLTLLPSFISKSFLAERLAPGQSSCLGISTHNHTRLYLFVFLESMLRKKISPALLRARKFYFEFENII